MISQHVSGWIVGLGLVALGVASGCGDESGTGAGTCVSQGGSAGQGAGPTTTTSTGGTGGSGTTTTGTGGSEPAPSGSDTGNADFDHMNDPGQSGQKDPFEILKEHAEEGPPEVRSRLHGCTKIRYDALGQLLSSRGVNLAATGNPKTAGQLYTSGGDAMGQPKFDAREAEAYFHTTSGATKLFDIFVQASPEIIANIQNAEACKINGVGKPMFDPSDGSCVRETLSCLMGRPATEDDLILCNQLVSNADGTQADIDRKRQLAVAAFLSAANTCE